MTGDLQMNDWTGCCGDPAALAGYLYGECDDAERAAIEAHLAVCAGCAAELASLGATRSVLASWTPPEVELGFKITATREAAEPVVLRPARWWSRPLPAWAQAAAAVVIFAAGAALGIRSAPSSVPETTATAHVADAPAGPRAVTADDMARLEQRLRQEMQALRAASAAPAAQSGSGDEQTLQRVRRLLAESEERQQREFAVRLTQVLREVESQRRLDLARIERTFGQIEGTTRPELAEQRQLLNYLIRTASQRPQ